MVEVLFYLGLVTGVIGLFATYWGCRAVIKYSLVAFSLLMLFASQVATHLGY